MLSFRLGKIPVNISPSFFLMTVLLGGLGGQDLRSVIAWVLIVLASVLLHELGHATMGIAFGLAPSIALHGMGGTTSWSAGQNLSPARRIAISLAGPGAGFVAAGIVWALGPAHLGKALYALLLDVNCGWGVMNLLPMLPLDGGNVMAQVFNAATHGRGARPAYVVSIAFAAAAAVLAIFSNWRYSGWWSALLATSFAASNWRGLKELAARDADAPMRAALDQAYAALDRKDAARVLELARPVALESRAPAVRAEALQLLAFGFLLEGRVADADAAIAALPEGYVAHPTLVKMRAAAKIG